MWSTRLNISRYIVQKILWEVRAQILGKGGFLKTVENRCVCEAYYQNIKNELEKKKKKQAKLYANHQPNYKFKSKKIIAKSEEIFFKKPLNRASAGVRRGNGGLAPGLAETRRGVAGEDDEGPAGIDFQREGAGEDDEGQGQSGRLPREGPDWSDMRELERERGRGRERVPEKERKRAAGWVCERERVWSFWIWGDVQGAFFHF